MKRTSEIAKGVAILTASAAAAFGVSGCGNGERQNPYKNFSRDDAAKVGWVALRNRDEAQILPDPDVPHGRIFRFKKGVTIEGGRRTSVVSVYMIPHPVSNTTLLGQDTYKVTDQVKSHPVGDSSSPEVSPIGELVERDWHVNDVGEPIGGVWAAVDHGVIIRPEGSSANIQAGRLASTIIYDLLNDTGNH